MQQPTITILGGGFSGSMVALQLARQPGAWHGGTVHLVEPRPVPGPGLAYTARRPEYLLNVRAAALSAFPDQPTHFTDWLQANGLACEQSFCSRQTYGRYLQELVAGLLAGPAANGLQFEWHPQAATAAEMSPDGRRATVHLPDGTALISDAVVLALGNFPPLSPAGPGAYLTHPNFHGNPWAAGALRTIGLDEEVLLIGSGLTAVDVLLGLRADGHRAPVTIVSRHQRWPVVHGPATAPYPSFYHTDLQDLASVGAVLATVRRRIRQAAAQGHDWRPVFDSLRPHLGQIWAAWPPAEQARFLRHLASLWAVLRHRSPPQNDAIMRDMLATGQARMHLGRVRGISVADNHDLLVHTQHQHTESVLRTQHVVSCTGPLLDYSRISDPLVVSLRDAGQLVPDALRLGIQTDARGALLNRHGQPSQVLFTLGPSRRPAYFESTAVPELREQAVALARELASRWQQ
ncbi:FAD/NAD(P)-binding protein [Hymenobacter canadensis]|uniref:FAD/NAD(P)-binding protein n=1 Tax=Hymenobacter canadensis TaxID=2999067 RepID=A0ABY7LV05_9BACT|nr:FAD/NAD(P)-binding protein [Hymenobacter canadensis]WBA43767.1 FAD/NAD(P)-binding protein [Hymenobacter canadensis]